MKSVLIFSLLFCLLCMVDTESFKAQQLKYPRVRNAYKEKNTTVTSMLKYTGVSNDKLELFIRIFKKEKLLEVWAKNDDESTFKSLVSYPFCATSGKLGPKRQQGDLQIPEGIYHIDRFNPASNFHLSLGVNYPNKADKILGGQRNLGGDIFLHGGCVTIGCVPITNDKIKELYILAVEAKNRGQRKINVHIFPSKLNSGGIQWLKENQQGKFPDLWNELQPIYQFFEQNRRLPQIKIKSDGAYYISS